MHVVYGIVVVTHGEIRLAAPTCRPRFGYLLVGVSANTADFLDVSLRSGNAGSITTADRIDVQGESSARASAWCHRGLLGQSDGAGVSSGAAFSRAGPPGRAFAHDGDLRDGRLPPPDSARRAPDWTSGSAPTPLRIPRAGTRGGWSGEGPPQRPADLFVGVFLHEPPGPASAICAPGEEL